MLKKCGPCLKKSGPCLKNADFGMGPHFGTGSFRVVRKNFDILTSKGQPIWTGG